MATFVGRPTETDQQALSQYVTRVTTDLDASQPQSHRRAPINGRGAFEAVSAFVTGVWTADAQSVLTPHGTQA